MKSIVEYFKGIGGLIAVAVLLIAAVVFFFLFDLIYISALAILAVVAVLVLPYYFGRKNKPETKGKYSLRKIK